MATTSLQEAANVFDEQRPMLVSVSYRMLGSVAEAEDVVQDAFLRWLDTDRASVREPGAYLRRVVTRLSLDVLKSARKRREAYVGTWLPEPVLEATPGQREDVTLPLLLAMERLSPLERAAFLLHDVFGLGFDDVAETIERDEAACRQLASRARVHVRAAQPRFEVSRERGLEIAEAFFRASRSGEMAALRSLLADDVTMHADGGGKRPAISRSIAGVETVVRLHAAAAKFVARAPSHLVRYAMINGLPGFVTVEGDNTVQTTALGVRDGLVAAIYVVRNPEKLRHLDLQSVAAP